MADEVKAVACTRLSSKNQVTVPVKVLREAGLAPGDVLEVEASEPGRIVLRRHVSRFDDVVGTIPGLEIDIEADREAWNERDIGVGG